MRQQTIIKAIVYVFLLSSINSCSVHKSRMPSKQMTFKDSFLVSVLQNGDTISPECLDEIDNFKKGLEYTGDIVKSYIHKDTFDIAFGEILPCLKNIKLASWFLLFPAMKYVVPWTNTQDPYYSLNTINKSGTNGYIIEFKDSLYLYCGPIIIRSNYSDPIGY